MRFRLKLGPKFNLGFHQPCHRNENPVERSELQAARVGPFLLHSDRIVWEVEEDGVCISFFTRITRKKAFSLPGAFSDAHKPKVGTQSDPACMVAQGASFAQAARGKVCAPLPSPYGGPGDRRQNLSA